MNSKIRSTALYASLICAAFSTAAATAVAIPSVSALAQDIRPAIPPADLLAYADHASAAEREISAGMQTLISEFVTASIRMAATDLAGDAEGIGIVAQHRTKALTALAFHAPENVVELATKLAVITEFSEDTERFALRAVVEDANRLVGGSR